MKVKISLLLITLAFMTYSCAVSCGPGPGQSTKPVSYPGGYTIDKQDEKATGK